MKKRKTGLITLLAPLLGLLMVLTVQTPAKAAGSTCSSFIESPYNWLQDACLSITSAGSITGSTGVLYRPTFAGSRVQRATVYMRVQDTATGRWQTTYSRDITADARIRNPKRYNFQLGIGAPPGKWYRAEAWVRVTTASGTYDSSTGIGNHPFTDQIRS